MRWNEYLMRTLFIIVENIELFLFNFREGRNRRAVMLIGSFSIVMVMMAMTRQQQW